MDAERLEAAAGFLTALRRGATAVDGLPERLAPADLPAAYTLQDRLNARLRDAGLGPLAGHKIGCTTAVMQDYLGISHPCAGALFASTIAGGEGRWSRSRLARPGVECEIAVEISRDVTDPAAATPEAIAAHVGRSRASIELVDDRWRDFAAVGTPTLIADNFFNAGCVLGPPVDLQPERLDALEGEMRVNGRSVGAGRGADILGHPLCALAWLARHRIESGAPLRTGEVVSLGSMVQTVWLEAGDRVEITVAELGTCRLAITA